MLRKSGFFFSVVDLFFVKTDADVGDTLKSQATPQASCPHSSGAV